MARFEAMEMRLTVRINDWEERILERLRLIEVSFADLTELARTTNTMLATNAGMLTDLVCRLTDLEKEKLSSAVSDLPFDRQA
ncbi:MAG: hypothetical protein ACJ8AI_08320 [Rhodopila sp.]